MRKQSLGSRTVVGLAVTLALALSVASGVPASAQPVFTGDVEANFVGPNILTFVDAGGKDVLVLNHTTPGTSSGWDIKDVRLEYDASSDILYVGVNSYETVGDADSDGDEGGMTYGPGTDVPNLGVGESAAVYFDLDQDTNWDVIAGVPDTTDFSGFTVKAAIGTTPNMALFGANLATGYDHADPTPYWLPTSAPDFEFRILNFSHLPNQSGELGAFTIGAFMGSWADVSIIEDTLIGSTSPAIDIEKYVSVDNGVTWLDADLAPGPTALVGNNVSFYVSVCNNGTANLTNILVSDTDFTFTGVVTSLAPGACDNSTIVTTTAVAGQQWDVANVTAQANGFPVFDEDPAYYTGLIPAIDIEKYVSVDNGVTWLDADLAPGPTALVGNNVSFYVSVCNVGTANLTNILVSDTDFTFTGIVTSLAPGACDNSTIVTTTAVAGQQWDVANVTAQADGTPVFDEDPAYYSGSVPVPAIDIEKHTNGVDADYAPGPYISVNSSVNWTYIVTNSGAVNLTGIVVTDDKVGTIGTISFLAVNATETLYASGLALAGQYVNNATVIGYYGTVNVTDWDPSHYYNSPATVGWETYSVNKARVLLPWIALLGAIIAGAGLRMLRRRRLT